MPVRRRQLFEVASRDDPSAASLRAIFDAESLASGEPALRDALDLVARGGPRQ